MSELLKDNLSYDNVLSLAKAINKQWAFDLANFEKALLNYCQLEVGADSGWNFLTLMQRLKVSAKALHAVIPEKEGAAAVVSTFQHAQLSHHELADKSFQNKKVFGWLSLIGCEYIAIHKQLNIDIALTYLKQMTEYFSAEFAIRRLILADPERVLTVLNHWLDDENEHVRRLISEGTRPRLPWGIRLPIFIQHPQWVLPLLKALRDDPSEYVRRSVANHLNDVAKDHPELIITIAQQWLSKSELGMLKQTEYKNRHKLIRHACRTLLKQGNEEVLSLFGYYPAQDIECTLSSSTLEVPFGGVFEFELQLNFMGSQQEEINNNLMIDYVLHFQKANAKQAAKVFKWLDRKGISKEQEHIIKQHSFKAISTRKYYPGTHTLEVMVNGKIKAKIDFQLLAPSQSYS